MKIVFTRPPLGPLNGPMGTFDDAQLLNDNDVVLFSFRAAELRWLGDAPDISRIPAGDYQALYQWSNDFQRYLYHLQNVPGEEPGSWRTDCMLHNGNYAGDVSLKYKTDIKGCTIVGDSIGTLDPDVVENNNPKLYNGPQTVVRNSVTTLGRIIALTKGVPITVTYQDAA